MNVRKYRRHDGTTVKAHTRKKSDIIRDKQRKALHPGKRESSSGGTYYEWRENRADKDRRTRL